VRSAFALLADVAQGEFTQWSIVYDLRERRAYFRTRLAPQVRWLDLDALGLSCDTPVQVLDIHAAHEGDVSPRLGPYDYDHNLGLVRAAFTKTPFLRAVPLKAREQLARYPQTTTCAAAGGRGSEK